MGSVVVDGVRRMNGMGRGGVGGCRERAKVTGADPPSLTARTPSPRPRRLEKGKDTGEVGSARATRRLIGWKMAEEERNRKPGFIKKSHLRQCGAAARGAMRENHCSGRPRAPS